jgi:hypothetical protein
LIEVPKDQFEQENIYGRSNNRRHKNNGEVTDEQN